MNKAYINNKAYTFEKGETILKFVKRNLSKEMIPTLCDAPNLDPFGSCRICSVEVALEKDGSTKTMASCHTPIVAGQYV